MLSNYPLVTQDTGITPRSRDESAANIRPKIRFAYRRDILRTIRAAPRSRSLYIVGQHFSNHVLSRCHGGLNSGSRLTGVGFLRSAQEPNASFCGGIFRCFRFFIPRCCCRRFPRGLRRCGLSTSISSRWRKRCFTSPPRAGDNENGSTPQEVSNFLCWAPKSSTHYLGVRGECGEGGPSADSMKGALSGYAQHHPRLAVHGCKLSACLWNECFAIIPCEFPEQPFVCVFKSRLILGTVCCFWIQ